VTTIAVEAQRFDFDDGWSVLGYDKDPYRQKHLGESECVDIVALGPERKLYLIEVKDYRGVDRAKERREDILSGVLFKEIGRKVRGTVAGLIGGWRNDTHRARYQSFAPLLLDSQVDIHVIAWIEHSYQERDPARLRLTTETDLLKRQVRWLGARALVMNSQSPRQLPGLRVQDDPRLK
jgi:hypothetical protein